MELDLGNKVLLIFPNGTFGVTITDVKSTNQLILTTKINKEKIVIVKLPTDE